MVVDHNFAQELAGGRCDGRGGGERRLLVGGAILRTSCGGGGAGAAWRFVLLALAPWGRRR